MRMADWMTLFVATALGFTAYIVWFAGAPWQAAAVVAAVGVVMAVLVLTRAHTRPEVVIVGRRAGGRLGRLEYGLDDAGYAVRYCPGPSDRPCPVLAGEPCRIHGGDPMAALLYVADGQTDRLPPCGVGLDVPVIAVEERPGAPAAADPAVAARVSWVDGIPAVETAVRHAVPRR